ncbi:MAG TPA: DUF507 family protein [Candidatus Angelobacter sp.]|nr:DUF507 family protein [Candidatus Angelobacter sp.]
MRLSRDKVNKLAHSVMDALTALDSVEFIEDPNTIRMEARRVLEELLNAEEKIDLAARQKIESQRRTITEGTQEWDILYRKYYNEEVKKLGI